MAAEEMSFDGNITETSPRNSFADVAQRVGKDKVKRKGEREMMIRVLDEIDMISVKRMSEGFNSWNFSFGVFNCFVICYIFGELPSLSLCLYCIVLSIDIIDLSLTYNTLLYALKTGAHPEHLWVIYLVEGMYMIPRKFFNMWKAKPLNQALYYLDFCWCMNFTAFSVILLLVFSGIFAHDEGLVSDVARKSFFNALMGVACGTLMGANIVLPFVACLFHDVNTMTGLFIHLMPPMVMYTFMWHADELRDHYPSIFHLTYLEGLKYFPVDGIFFTPGTGLESVAGNSVALYLLWWIPYVCFQLLIGIDLPKKIKDDGTPAKPKWDTVFHSTMRQGLCVSIGKVFRGRSKKDSIALCMDNNFDLIDFSIYMIAHGIAAMAAFYGIGYPCFESQQFHLFMIIFVTWLAVARGAKRYTYYTTKMYGRVLREQFSDQLDE